MNQTLNLLSDNSEQVPYNNSEIPIYINKGKLSNFLNFTAPAHWHDDVEFSLILSGKMSYNVNGTTHTLQQGEGIFVNSRQFHSNFSSDGTDCEYICVLLNPILLCANQFFEKNYVLPVIFNDGFQYSILTEGALWKNKILADIEQIYHIGMGKGITSDILIQSLFFQIWSVLFENMPDKTSSPIYSDNRLFAFREMIGFLQKNYQDKISLSEIAAAGKVCQSSCCSIFNEYLHQTPIQYLINYRLTKSAELLRQTTLNITEIAFKSGFVGASYYTETFRKHFGCSPTEYRREK